MKMLPRPSYAVVIGVALLMFLTTTGGAVAGGLITGKKIKDGTITGADIKNKSVGVTDLAPAARPVAGPAGPAGTPGDAGPRGLSAWDTIPSGTTVTGVVIFDGSTTGASTDDAIVLQIPGQLPVALANATMGFGASSANVKSGDVDLDCTGNAAAPTAPPGQFCVYTPLGENVKDLVTTQTLLRNAVSIQWTPATTTAGEDMWFSGTWAYTAP
ncbi:hypothetical protein GCM10009795_062950 [Nocardioides hankookensis]|uniref:Collagen-like protein n=1 Tax=Nocardioides hankookensis TaxID=443157 RepID=A0ABW1LNE3_9ACTN